MYYSEMDITEIPEAEETPDDDISKTSKYILSNNKGH